MNLPEAMGKVLQVNTSRFFNDDTMYDYTSSYNK